MSPSPLRALAFAAAVGLPFVLACKRAQGPAAEVDAASSSPPQVATAAIAAPTPPPPESAPADAGASPVDDAGHAFTEASPVGGRSIGHTSVAFMLLFSDGEKAAFKPASRRGPLRYKGEIAAYRLALALGLTNVPRAYPRTFRRDDLVAAVGGPQSSAGALVLAETIEADGKVAGVISPWVEPMVFLPVEEPPLRTSVRAWLTRARPIPKVGTASVDGVTLAFDASKVAAQLSTLIAFDFLTGNWDRYSGANVGFSPASGTVLFIDNDGAFFERPPADALRVNEKRLASVDRFARGFIARVRALDDEALSRALGDEHSGVPLLSARVIEQVARRRRALLDLVDAKIRRTSEAETLFFQ